MRGCTGEREPGEVLRIHCCCYEENIYPWTQENIRTPTWRFYWNPIPGGYIRSVNGEEPLLPEYFYILPGYFCFSTFARVPFAQFFIHFNLHERQVRLNEMLRVPADEVSKELIRGFIRRGNSEENLQLSRLTALSVVSSALLRLPENILRLPPEYDFRIERVLQWISGHPDTACGNDFLAQTAGMSRNGFLRLFERETGESPQKYCRRKRIEHACRLLHFSDLSIDEIAAETGFSDRYHFSRVFRRVTRFTPAAFRKQIREFPG